MADVSTDFVSLNAARATPELIRKLHARGKKAHVWTVNTEEAMLLMIERVASLKNCVRGAGCSWGSRSGSGS